MMVLSGGGVSGGCFPRKKLKLSALRSLLRPPYLYPNATRVHGGSNTTVHHDTRQSSGGFSVTIVDLVRVGPASYR